MSASFMTTSTTPTIIRTSINLARAAAGYVPGECDRLIRKSLERAGLHSDRNLFTVFNYSRARAVAKTGLTIPPHEDVLYAFTRDQLAWDNNQPNCLRVCTRQVLEPGIAVYDRGQLKPATDGVSDFGYEFVDKSQARDALVGIVRLKMPEC